MNRFDQAYKKLSAKGATLGSEVPPMDVIPTGILALDYMLGTGGWPRRHMVGIYGPPEIGKSTVLGYSAIREVQKLGLVPAIVAVEPHFDADWAIKHGIDPKRVLITRPTTGEEAFDDLYNFVVEGADMVLFDSVGAIISEVEAGAESKNRAGGQSGLITWGVKRVLPHVYANNVCVLMINQVRDIFSVRAKGYKQPGGHGLEHGESIIIQLRPWSGQGGVFNVGSGDKQREIGRRLVAGKKKNKVREGTGDKAIFDFYNVDVEGYPFGVDALEDTINTGKLTGVIKQSGPYYTLPDGTKHQGKKAVDAHLAEHPKVVDQIRKGVLDVMAKNAYTPEPEEDEAA